MDGRTEPPDFVVNATCGDSGWKPVGYAWLNEDGSVLFGIEWSPHLMFMLVKAEDAVEGIHGQD